MVGGVVVRGSWGLQFVGPCLQSKHCTHGRDMGRGELSASALPPSPWTVKGMPLCGGIGARALDLVALMVTWRKAPDSMRP